MLPPRWLLVTLSLGPGTPAPADVTSIHGRAPYPARTKGKSRFSLRSKSPSQEERSQKSPELPADSAQQGAHQGIFKLTPIPFPAAWLFGKDQLSPASQGAEVPWASHRHSVSVLGVSECVLTTPEYVKGGILFDFGIFIDKNPLLVWRMDVTSVLAGVPGPCSQ